MRKKILYNVLLIMAAGCGWCSHGWAENETFYVVEVTAATEAELQALLQMPLIVDNVEGLAATLYLTGAGYDRIRAMGYATRLIEIQPTPPSEDKTFGYIAYADLGPLLEGYAASYPHLCRVQSLGKSVKGRELWAIMITANPDEPADKPAVKYIATIHGDEPLGMVLCLNFAEELLTTYASDSYIQDLLGRTILWLVPLMNPDGYVNFTRVNANNWDLNRSFPAYGSDYTSTWYDTGVLGDGGRQIETVNIMRWNTMVPGALSANFHGGSLVANYPYDNEPGIPSGVEAISPDDDVFRYISLEYTRNNPPMYASTVFTQGIVNGSRWYTMTGGMMDWNYRFIGCPEVTMEVSTTKRPSSSLLPQFWEDNRDSMFAYAETAHIGIRGLVRDRNTEEPVWAKIWVDGRDQSVFSNPEVGNYHRLLLPGQYNLSIQAEDFITYHVDDIEVVEGPASRADVLLSDGDLNADGIVDEADIQLAVDAALGRTVAVDADVDGRGLAATDIQAVINRSLAKAI